MATKLTNTGIEFPDGTAQASRALDYGNCSNCSAYTSLSSRPTIPANCSNCDNAVYASQQSNRLTGTYTQNCDYVFWNCYPTFRNDGYETFKSGTTIGVRAYGPNKTNCKCNCNC